jgi:hypothetical protein
VIDPQPNDIRAGSAAQRKLRRTPKNEKQARRFKTITAEVIYGGFILN